MHTANLRDTRRPRNARLDILPLMGRSAANRGELGSQILDQLEFGIAVVDSAAQTVFANAALQEFFHQGGLIGRTPGGRLYFSRSEIEAQFRAALGKSCEGGGGKGVTFLVGDGLHACKCVVTVQPLPMRMADEQSVLVTMTPISTAPMNIPVEQLMESFGLTAAEKRLAQFLMTGGRLADAAQSFGLSLHTVRNQLRAIFAKMGVRRQSDLTRLLCGGYVARVAA